MLIWTIVSIGTNTALAFSPNYVLLCILRVILGAGKLSIGLFTYNYHTIIKYILILFMQPLAGLVSYVQCMSPNLLLQTNVDSWAASSRYLDLSANISQ